jgi:hypothetical protein
MTARAHLVFSQRFARLPCNDSSPENTAKLRHVPAILSRASAAFAAVAALAGCASPALSAFDGRETESWLAFDLDYLDEVQPRAMFYSFLRRAKAFGCPTRGINGNYPGTVSEIYTDAPRTGHGVAAYCADGVIAIFAMRGARVKVGCERPTTRDRCDALLKGIDEALPGDSFSFLGRR